MLEFTTRRYNDDVLEDKKPILLRNNIPMHIEDIIRQMALEYSEKLKTKVDQRVAEMKEDDKSHYLIYQVLGISTEEGRLIDVYQNKGRFLYNYAGRFLENAAKACFTVNFPDSGKIYVDNTVGQKPKRFEVDCLVNDIDAIEIKWRDATTDGDHITKEHTRLQSTKDANYKPIRVMFYYPNRTQAQRIQKTLETLYAGAGGEYHYGDGAWNYIKKYTGVDLKAILTKIAKERVSE